MGAFVPPPGQPKSLQPGEFASASRPSEITFGFHELSPAAFMYVRPEEQIRVGVTNSAAAVTSIVVSWRMMLTDGSLHVGVQNFTIAADSNPNTNVFLIPLHEGFLMSVRVGTLQANQRGQTFARLEVIRGSTVAQSQSTLLLAQGYIGFNSVMAYPGAGQANSVDGPGAMITQQASNPAAGADWVYTVPANHRQRVQSLHGVFTASATVANRNVQFSVDDGVNPLWFSSVPTTITAGQVIDVVATGTNSPTGVFTTVLEAVIPPGLVLSAGSRVKTATGNIQAGDQWANINLLVEDWLSV